MRILFKIIFLCLSYSTIASCEVSSTEQWSNWTPCTRTCGIGIRSRRRGSTLESVGCNEQVCVNTNEVNSTTEARNTTSVTTTSGPRVTTTSGTIQLFPHILLNVLLVFIFALLHDRL